MAFEKQMTVRQFLIKQILKSYYTLILKGEIPVSLHRLLILQQDNFNRMYSSFHKSLGSLLKLTLQSHYLQDFPDLDLSQSIYGNDIFLLYKDNSGPNIKGGIASIVQHGTSPILDLLYSSKFGPEKGVTQLDKSEIFNYKQKKKIITQVIQKLNLILRFDFVDVVMKLKMVQHRIELHRKLFILDLEKGEEVFIPQVLNQNDLPLSFRFYDCTMRYAQTTISQHKKQKITFIDKFYNRYQKDMMEQFANKVEEEKASIRHASIVETNHKQINHSLSSHAKEIQRSNYLKIDVNKSARAQSEAMGDGQIIKRLSLIQKQPTLYLQYCKPKEVDKKQRQKVRDMMQFLIKIQKIQVFYDKEMKMNQLHKLVQEQFPDDEKLRTSSSVRRKTSLSADKPLDNDDRKLLRQRLLEKSEERLTRAVQRKNEDYYREVLDMYNSKDFQVKMEYLEKQITQVYQRLAPNSFDIIIQKLKQREKEKQRLKRQQTLLNQKSALSLAPCQGEWRRNTTQTKPLGTKQESRSSLKEEWEIDSEEDNEPLLKGLWNEDNFGNISAGTNEFDHDLGFSGRHITHSLKNATDKRRTTNCFTRF